MRLQVNLALLLAVAPPKLCIKGVGKIEIVTIASPFLNFGLEIYFYIPPPFFLTKWIGIGIGMAPPEKGNNMPPPVSRQPLR